MGRCLNFDQIAEAVDAYRASRTSAIETARRDRLCTDIADTIGSSTTLVLDAIAAAVRQATAERPGCGAEYSYAEQRLADLVDLWG